MTIRILIHGAQGKMGQQTLQTLLALPTDFTVVGAIGREHDLTEEIKRTQPQVVIDFTTADVAFKHAQAIIDAGVHPVIGTSGLLEKQITLLQKQCALQQLGGIIAPNFSLAAVLMIQKAKDIVRYFPDVEIIEMHHNGKMDSPSGTALRTAECLSRARNDVPKKNLTTHETIPGARGATFDHIPIHAIRLPGLIARQEIIFGGLGETLTIRHDTIDRQCFMPGVILACKKVLNQKTLVVGLEHFLI